MNRRNIGVAVIALLLAALLGSTTLGEAQTIPVRTQPGAEEGVSTVGEGIVSVTPNIARITLGVEVTNQSLATAQAQAAQQMDAVVTKLKADGIAASDITTVSYNVNPQYDFQNNQNTLRGYQVQNLVSVRTTNVPGLGSLIDDVVGAGATRIYGVSFEADNMQALKDQARDQAMQNAQAKASQMARDAGVSLGKVVLIEENDATGANPVPAAAPAALAAPAGAARPTTPVQPGELQVRTTVHVVWSIQ